MAEVFTEFKVSSILTTEEFRLHYLNEILHDGDLQELKGALEDIAEAKGIELPPLEGETWLLDALKKLGYGFKVLANATAIKSA
ncbi:helix-turn-helix domain-containing transcriptional regulator [Helicobacter ailurogastricus]|uniref:Uncharacterized protein n=1 Tax=Helicobacter ailurogastricus TaxID=1578720 RepID=A0A0K2XZQ9_9HELI|nr:hypothetical protein [Helicobacter ailurogastricus]CRF52586.1 hypothetical protein HAL07_10510 [Helicobacter ailurogastricus]BDQ29724.1 hypothetical protein ASB7_15610 [Helicobacter ailurogastricus]GLH58371.1 hypothetical protein NHP214376_11620 [Helicobacter ailurogastricus]GLH59515.1 hypothetical protein NHP214377_07830 [Helicobacter ailurogastricus]GMB90829.1 hypothetical protein NHP190002_15610 [Helicobacter ailurogastricus]